jgi:hypothetical protein
VRRLGALAGVAVTLVLASPASAATVTFDGGPSGFSTDWDTAENWSGNALPTANDDVVIPSGFTAVLGTGDTGVADTLSLQGALHLDSTLTVGTEGDTTPDTSSLAATNNSQIRSGGKLRLNEVTNWSSGQWFFGSGGNPTPGIIENAGTLNATGTSTMNDGGGALGLLKNLPGATINRTTSSGTTDFQLPFDNDGTVNAQTGTLQLSKGSGSETSTGAYTVAAGATLQLGGVFPGMHTVDGSPASISGTGTVKLMTGGVTLAANDTYNVGTTLFSGGALILPTAGTTTAFDTDGANGSRRAGAGTLTVGTGSSDLNNIVFEGGGTTIFPAGATLAATGAVQVTSTPGRSPQTTRCSRTVGSPTSPRARRSKSARCRSPTEWSLEPARSAVPSRTLAGPSGRAARRAR